MKKHTPPLNLKAIPEEVLKTKSVVRWSLSIFQHWCLEARLQIKQCVCLLVLFLAPEIWLRPIFKAARWARKTLKPVLTSTIQSPTSLLALQVLSPPLAHPACSSPGLAQQRSSSRCYSWPLPFASITWVLNTPVAALCCHIGPFEAIPLNHKKPINPFQHLKRPVIILSDTHYVKSRRKTGDKQP